MATRVFVGILAPELNIQAPINLRSKQSKIMKTHTIFSPSRKPKPKIEILTQSDLFIFMYFSVTKSGPFTKTREYLFEIIE